MIKFQIVRYYYGSYDIYCIDRTDPEDVIIRVTMDSSDAKTMLEHFEKDFTTLIDERTMSELLEMAVVVAESDSFNGLHDENPELFI